MPPSTALFHGVEADRQAFDDSRLDQQVSILRVGQIHEKLALHIERVGPVGRESAVPIGMSALCCQSSGTSLP